MRVINRPSGDADDDPAPQEVDYTPYDGLDVVLQLGELDPEGRALADTMRGR